VSWQDYQGKFGKTVGVFARRLERRSVHKPRRYKPGAILCTLEPKDKFILSVQNTFDPVTFISTAYDAGIGQAEDSDPSFGQGAAGYGKRFGVSLADQASSEFFKVFAYPTVFSEDPRYYRMGEGAGGKRMFHAAVHVLIAHREDGMHMFNFSEWLGNSSSGFDILREFWPEIARKLKLPFRGQPKP
jgi:hypothetical protein